MNLIPIQERLEENETLMTEASFREVVQVTVDFYKKVGFEEPWIGYLVEENGNLVGAAGFKGRPINGTIEIAYGTFENYRKKGIGTAICKQLVDLSLKTDASIKITARTLPEKNFSTRILEKNNFTFTGTVNDPEDGDVWEWALETDSLR